MYRDEPPKEYHSPARNCETPLSAMPSVILAGASSAPSQPWRKWIPLDGHSRDGKPAYIPISAQTKGEVKSAARKDDYILGRYDSVTGYYHIETREAHAIMVARLNHRVKQAKSDLAMQHGCCGDAEHRMERKLAKVQKTREVWRERLAAGKPTGSTRNQDINSERLNRDDGAWLYPAILHRDAGGACGGAAATTDKCQQSNGPPRSALSSKSTHLCRRWRRKCWVWCRVRWRRVRRRGRLESAVEERGASIEIRL
jgi:hypothetical protein